MLQRMVGEHKSSWHLKLFSTLQAYIILVKTTTGFTPFQLVYGLEVVLPIEFEIPSFRLAVELLPNTSTEEELFIYLTNLYETHQDVVLDNESHKKCIKAQYDNSVQPHIFNE